MDRQIPDPETKRGLQIAEAILDEFQDKNIPVDVGLHALTECFLRSLIAAEISTADFMRLCSNMMEIVQFEEEVRKNLQK